MPEKEIALKITAKTGDAISSVKGLKTAIKEAKDELILMTNKFGETSSEALNAAKKVALLKNQVSDANERVKLFDPGNKFGAIAGTVSGLAAGFSAVQGAMGLVGIKSEEVQKQLLKVQSAMAFSQGISGVLDAGKNFTRLGAIIKTNVVAAFSTLRGAIISTGIGALIVGLGLLVTNFEKVKVAIENMIPGSKQVFEWIGKMTDKIKQFLGIGPEWLKQDHEKIRQDAYNKQQQILKEQEAASKAKLAEQKAAGAARLAEQKRQQQEDAKAREAALKNAADLEKTIANELRLAKLSDRDRETTVINDKHIERIKTLKAQGLSTYQAEELLRIELRALQDKWDAADLEAKNVKDKAELDSVKTFAAKKNEQIDAAFKVASDKRDADLAQEKLVADSKIMLQARVGDALAAFSDLVGRETAAGKAFAIAQATMNTYLAATGILTARNTPGVPAPIAVAIKIASAAAVIANGLAAVRNIVKTKVPGGGGGGGMSVSTTSAPLQALPQIGQTQLDAAQVSQIGNAASRAYIVEADVTTGQERIERLNRAARLV